MERQLLVYALPLFAVSIVLDWLVDRWRGTGRYRPTDAVTSLGVGFVGTATGALTAGFVGFFYVNTYDAWHAFAIPDSVATFVLSCLAYDFLYYWYHRAHHRVNVLWAAHAAHHNSEDFNFTTALRQSALVFASTWPFFLPMALLGFRLEQYLAGAAVSVIYGFFTHTESGRYMGWLEAVFVGPSSHRVHHGVNTGYLDKNYGSILTIWDRLFGTYAKEGTGGPVIFGTTVPLASFNPLQANFGVYRQIAAQGRGLTTLREKLLIWVQPPDWLATKAGNPGYGVTAPRRRYDTAPAKADMTFALYLYGLAALGTADLMLTATRNSMTHNAVYCVAVIAATVSAGLYLEARATRRRFEMTRALVTAILLATAIQTTSAPEAVWFDVALAAQGIALAWQGLGPRLSRALSQ